MPTQPDSLELDPVRYELRRSGRVLRLEKIPMELLILLVERKDQLVGRDEIIDKLWGKDVFLDTEQGINTAIRKIRLALRDDPNHSRYIQTVVGKGYRFIGPIRITGQPEDDITREAEGIPRETAALPALLGRFRPLRIGGIAIAVVAIGALVAFLLDIDGIRHRFLARNPPIRSIAVLPFDNLSGDARQDYFADGMTDELITNLAKIKSLRVISRTSVMQYKSGQRSLPEIARTLNVSAVVEGAVSRSGNRVHITAQLVDARSDMHLWAQEFDRNLEDAAAVQLDIAQTIAHQVRAEMTPGDATRLSPRRQLNTRAYDLYLQGRYKWSRKTASDLQESITLYQRALAEDPDYALAYADLADSYIVLENMGEMPATEANPRIRSAAMKAVETDPALADAHMVMAAVRESEWDWAAAEQEYRRAIELNPGLARAHHWYALLMILLRRPDEAISEIARAIDLDPVSDSLHLVQGQMYYQTRRYEDAQRSLQILAGTPRMSGGVHATLGLIDLAKQMHGEAVSEFLIATRNEPNEPSSWAFLTYAYSMKGEKENALQASAHLLTLSKEHFVEPTWLAVAWIGLRDNDKAIQCLNEAYQSHSNVFPFAQVDPVFDPLRSDPRFQQLLRRMTLLVEGSSENSIETRVKPQRPT